MVTKFCANYTSKSLVSPSFSLSPSSIRPLLLCLFWSFLFPAFLAVVRLAEWVPHLRTLLHPLLLLPHSTSLLLWQHFLLTVTFSPLESGSNLLCDQDVFLSPSPSPPLFLLHTHTHNIGKGCQFVQSVYQYQDKEHQLVLTSFCEVTPHLTRSWFVCSLFPDLVAVHLACSSPPFPPLQFWGNHKYCVTQQRHIYFLYSSTWPSHLACQQMKRSRRSECLCVRRWGRGGNQHHFFDSSSANVHYVSHAAS